MKILGINTVDKRGGAAKVATRLMHELEELGHVTRMRVGEKEEESDKVQRLEYGFFDRGINKIFRLHGLRYSTYRNITSDIFFKTADIIHLHNIHGGYFNVNALPVLAAKKPVVWTLHDPWIVEEHGDVPEYEGIFTHESRRYYSLKQSSIIAANVVFVTPSDWLRSKVVKYYPMKRIEIIRNGIDTDIFVPTDKKGARARLNLPQDKKIVLFVANGGTDNKSKGGEIFQGVKDFLGEKDIAYIDLGEGSHYVSTESDMALYYAASDLLLFPSFAENLPLVVLEAMACGTPVVAFSTGGVPEIIDHTINGYIAKKRDAKDLVFGVSLFLKNDELAHNASEKAREKIMKNFSLKEMVKNYIMLYQELV